MSDVIPKRRAISRPRRKPSSYSAAVGSGTIFSTSPPAVSRSVPEGLPAESRSMRPLGGSGVSRVTRASSSAFVFAQVECPSDAEISAGRSETIASSSCREGLAAGKIGRSHPPPRIQGSFGWLSA
jgi:hypothetical protein